MSDNLTIFGKNYSTVAGFKAKDTDNNTLSFIRPVGTVSISSNSTVDVTNYAIADVNVSGGGGYVIQNQDGSITLPSTGDGSDGSSAQTATGTFTGSGTTQEQISCSFAPDLIYVYGDLTGDVSLRGITSIVIIKDTALYVVSDGSTSSSQPSLFAIDNNITGYNEANLSTDPYASYSNGTLTLDIVVNTTAAKFNSSITYSYKLVKYTNN